MIQSIQFGWHRALRLSRGLHKRFFPLRSRTMPILTKPILLFNSKKFVSCQLNWRWPRLMNRVEGLKAIKAIYKSSLSVSPSLSIKLFVSDISFDRQRKWHGQEAVVGWLTDVRSFVEFQDGRGVLELIPLEIDELFEYFGGSTPSPSPSPSLRLVTRVGNCQVYAYLMGTWLAGLSVISFRKKGRSKLDVEHDILANIQSQVPNKFLLSSFTKPSDSRCFFSRNEKLLVRALVGWVVEEGAKMLYSYH